MSRLKKNRNAFRPTLGNGSLEERVVLNGASAVGGHVAAAATSAGTLTARQLVAGYAAQNRAAFTNLNQSLRQQIAQLYANGKPTAQQLAGFNASVAGQINAVALQLSSQESLLPNSAKRLVPNLQSALMSQRNSLLSRIQTATATPRVASSPRLLQTVIQNQINTAFTSNRIQLANYLNNTNFARASVDQNGNPISLQQYVGQQIVNQFGGTLNGLSQAFGNVANSSLYANGVTSPSASALQSFQNQYTQALNVAAFQLGSDLNLLNGASSTLAPMLQSSIFGTTGTGTGTGTGTPSSLYSTLQALPYNGSATDLSTGIQNAFTNAFPMITGPLNTRFSLNGGTSTSALPSYANTFAPTFTSSNYFGGFDSGYGSGFPGFGTASTNSNLNPNFGQGFNNFVTTANTNFGFSQPSISTGTGTGTGTGSGSGGTGLGL